MTEREFTDQVIELAGHLGWRVAHFRPARTAHGWRTPVAGDGKGFPDLVLVGHGVVLFVELKVGRNRPTPEQRDWLEALAQNGAVALVWHPDDWEHVQAVLSGDWSSLKGEGES